MSYAAGPESQRRSDTNLIIGSPSKEGGGMKASNLPRPQLMLKDLEKRAHQNVLESIDSTGNCEGRRI